MSASADGRRLGRAALAALVALAPRVAAAQEQMPEEFRGDWVAASATCQAPARFRVTANRFTLINGRDSQEYGDVTLVGPSYFGPDYSGIQAVGIPEFNGDQPFRATFNAGEKRGAAVLKIYTEMQGQLNPALASIQAKAKRLAQRFPLNDVPLKKCAGPAGPAAAPPGRSASLCRGRPSCSEIPAMAVAVEDFRITIHGGSRYAAATLRLTNKSTAPLTLGYVQGSGLVTDDRGNRYRLAGPVRGLGEINASTFDPKFTLQPGESGDARFEFAWSGAQNQFFGTVFALDLALRDIVPETAGQFRLGQERTWRWTGLQDMAAGVGAQVAAVPASAAEPPRSTGAPVRTAIADPCGGDGLCAFASPVAAQVTQVSVTKASGYQFVKLNVRFRNLGDRPFVLCYSSGSAVGADDRGNRYAVRDDRVRGIGICRRGVADPQFALAPDQARDATIEYAVGIYRGTVLGTVWTASLTASELELLPGDQIRTGRELLFSFRDMTAGSGARTDIATPAAPTGAPPEGTACGDTKWCDDAGIFTAQVTRVTLTKASGYQFVGLNVRVTNRLDEPLILCYQSGSAVGSDERGNRYAVRNDRVKGIGICARGSADPQFALRPGESRNWTIDYHVGIYRGTVIGTEWKADFTLQRLTPLTADQLQTAGDHAVSFEGLAGQAGQGGGLLGEVRKLIRK